MTEPSASRIAARLVRVWRTSPSGRSTRISPNHSSPASAAADIDSKIADAVVRVRDRGGRRCRGSPPRRGRRSRASGRSRRSTAAGGVRVDDAERGRHDERAERVFTRSDLAARRATTASVTSSIAPMKTRAARRSAPGAGSTRARTWRTRAVRPHDPVLDARAPAGSAHSRWRAWSTRSRSSGCTARSQSCPRACSRASPVISRAAG